MRIQGAVAKRKKTKLSVVIASLWASHGFFSARSMAPLSGARVERQNTAAPSMNRTWPPADAVTTSGEKRQPPAFRVLSTDASWTPSPSEAGPRSHTRGGTRTRNLLLRREAPYPLGHTSGCLPAQPVVAHVWTLIWPMQQTTCAHGQCKMQHLAVLCVCCVRAGSSNATHTGCAWLRCACV